MLRGFDTQLRSLSLERERVGTPPPSSPFSPAHPSSSNIRRKVVVPDRFIPQRSTGNFLEGFSVFAQRRACEASPVIRPVETSLAKQAYRQALCDTILPPVSPSQKVLPLTLSSTSARLPDGRFFSLTSPGGSDCGPPSASTRKRRHALEGLPKEPFKILDLPEIMDDYYINILDWSSTNILAVALWQTVYLFNAATGSIEELCTADDDDFITSVAWVQEGGQYIGVGTNQTEVQIWDVGAMQQLRSMKGHTGRVSSLAWNKHVISSGSRDSTIINHDVRIAKHVVARLEGAHDKEVKALAWSPFSHNILASGGGTSDRKICLWNTSNGTCLSEVDTKSQVCAIQWSIHDNEFVSAHGFSKNELILWRCYGAGRVEKVSEFTGHQARVLHMAQSPDGTTLVSAAADETLRFWKMFGSPTRSRWPADNAMSSSPRLRDEFCRLGVNCIR
mmetsp:Transcript_230/g.483  ORF Transcript_230/g.483 Transcript_230/m.483 type:complete len:448 (+) Transcript_230:114-1457(+)